MKIINKFVYDGVNNGYTIDDEGLQYGVTEIGLYASDILESLIATGYKIFGYYGNIMTPEGVLIRDLEEVPYTGTADDKQIMLDMADQALSESEASSYFTREISRQAMQLLPSTDEIKTREELFDYLQKWQLRSKLQIVRDVRPLNSFVAKEALFTLEEYAQDESLQKWVEIIEERRVLRSYSEVQQLLNFLQRYAGLKKRASADEIRQAYLSWGFCGFSTPFLSMQVKVGEVECGATEVCLMDSNGTIHSSRGSVNLLDTEASDSSLVTVYNDDAYEEALRTRYNWECKYKSLRCGVHWRAAMVYADLCEPSGALYQMKVDSDYFAVYNGISAVVKTSSLKYKLPDSYRVPIDRVIEKAGLITTVLCRSLAHKEVREHIVKPLEMSSIGMCLREGVSPYAAVEYLSEEIGKLMKGESGAVKIDYDNAAEMYRKGVSPAVVDKYNPDGLQYDTFEELVDIMSSTVDTMLDEGRLPAPGTMEYNANPVGTLRFAQQILRGELSIGYLSTGLAADKDTDVEDYAKMFSTLVKLECGENNSDTRTIMNTLMQASRGGLIDNNAFPMKTGAYYGYLKDRAQLNKKRAEQCDSAIYITKVFREISNTEASDNRHYAFEAYRLSVVDDDTRKTLTEVKEAIVAGISAANLPTIVKECLTTEAMATAIKLVYRIRLNTRSLSRVGVDFVVPLSLNVGSKYKEIGVKITDSLERKIRAIKFERIYDRVWRYCKYERVCGEWCLYCVNAKITPLCVIPNDGVKIDSYSFFVNYNERSGFEELPSKIVKKIESAHARVVSFFKLNEKPGCNGLIKPVTSKSDDKKSSLRMEYTVETIDDVLYDEEDESVIDYFDRFYLHKKDIRKSNPTSYLKRMRMRSDVYFRNYNEIMGYDYLKEDVVEKMTNENDMFQHILNYEVRSIGSANEQNLLEESGNVVTKFDISEEQFDSVTSWSELLTGDFKQYGIAVVAGYFVTFNTGSSSVQRDLRTIKLSEMEKLAEKHIVYQLGARQFLIFALNGKFKVDVMYD